ncbi:MAG: hypothetical protein E7214_00645 [Clostridium sp.]|nr:hypothetical protein [Clostridium sp.]
MVSVFQGYRGINIIREGFVIRQTPVRYSYNDTSKVIVNLEPSTLIPIYNNAEIHNGYYKTKVSTDNGVVTGYVKTSDISILGVYHK